MTARRATRRAWEHELDTFARAFSGAFLFGIPLLYTMEMWSIGTYLPPLQIVIFLTIAFVVNLGLAHFSGFRDHEHRHAADLEQAVEALAVGVVGSILVLLALDRIGFGDPLAKIVGVVGLQAVPLSIGATLANAVLVSRDAPQDDARSARDPVRAFAADVAATAVGAVFVSFNIAPTDEVRMLATDLRPIHLVAVVLLSLAVAYMIVFESEFGRAARRRAQTGPFQRPITETTVSYVVALGVAFVTLLLFGHIAPDQPAGEALARTLVLGLPASVGGAAGRLAI